MDVEDHWLQNSWMECGICIMGKSSRPWQWHQGLLFLFSLFVFICFCFIIWEVIRSDSYLRKNVLAAVWTMAQKSQRETNRGEDSMPSWSCFLWVTPACKLHEGNTVVWFCSPLHFQGLIVPGMENTLDKYPLFWFNGSAVLWATLCKRCLHHLRSWLEETCRDTICGGLVLFSPDLRSLTDMHLYSTLKCRLNVWEQQWDCGSLQLHYLSKTDYGAFTSCAERSS